MKTRTAIRLLLLSLFPVLLSAQPCGNLGGNCPPPCGQSGGTNLFNPLGGNVWREITDLELPAALGQRPLEFRRLSTSRYHGGLAMPMGPSGNWRHNYLWAIHHRGLNGEGHEMIEIHYPDGHNWTFAHATEDALYMTANSRTEDRVEKVADTSPQRYRLWRADGSRLEFVKYTDASGETAYKPLGEYDKHNLFYQYTLDSNNRVIRVTDPAGHYLQLNYGPVGNFTTAFVEFSHHAPDAESVSVAGDFNGWSTTAHPMVRDEDGRWTITVPLQANPPSPTSISSSSTETAGSPIPPTPIPSPKAALTPATTPSSPSATTTTRSTSPPTSPCASRSTPPMPKPSPSPAASTPGAPTPIP